MSLIEIHGAKSIPVEEPRPYTCANCRFWEEDSDNKGRGYCHFNPPQVVPLPTKLGQIAIHSFWPTTLKDKFCGHHKNFVNINKLNG